MNVNQHNLNAPDPLIPVRQRIEQEFPVLHQAQPHVLELALNEAEALAWQTGFPQLVFPELALEKAEAVKAWYQHQHAVWSSESRCARAQRVLEDYATQPANDSNATVLCNRELAAA